MDSVQLTLAALREREAMLGAFDARMRMSGQPLVAVWRPPMPMPRGWLPIPLGAERKMFVPYLNPFMSQMVPFYPGVGSSGGLVHSGIGSMGGGIPMGLGISPGPGGIGYSSHPGYPGYPSYSSYVPQGYYGYGYHPSPMIPVPYGYGMGLAHAGYEGAPIAGGFGPMSGFNPMMSRPMMGMGSMGSMPGTSMQPAWTLGSMGPMMPSNQMPSTPHN